MCPALAVYFQLYRFLFSQTKLLYRKLILREMIWATLGVLFAAKLSMAAEIGRVKRSAQGKDNLLNVCYIDEFQKQAAQPLNHSAVLKSSVASLSR